MAHGVYIFIHRKRQQKYCCLNIIIYVSPFNLIHSECDPQPHHRPILIDCQKIFSRKFATKWSLKIPRLNCSKQLGPAGKKYSTSYINFIWFSEKKLFTVAFPIDSQTRRICCNKMKSPGTKRHCSRTSGVGLGVFQGLCHQQQFRGAILNVS